MADNNPIRFEAAQTYLSNLFKLSTNVAEFGEIFLQNSFGGTLPVTAISSGMQMLASTGIKCWFAYDAEAKKLSLSFHKETNWVREDMDNFDNVPDPSQVPHADSIFGYPIKYGNDIEKMLLNHNHRSAGTIEIPKETLARNTQMFWNDFPYRTSKHVHETRSAMFGDEDNRYELQTKLLTAPTSDGSPVTHFRYYFGWGNNTLVYGNSCLRIIIMPVDPVSQLNILQDLDGNSTIFQKSWPPK